MDAEQFLKEFIQDRNFKRVMPYLMKNRILCEDLLKFIEAKAPYPKSEYASWLWLHISKENKEFAQEFYNRLVDLALQLDHKSVLRNVLASLSQLEITAYRESDMINLLFTLLLDKSLKVALHVYSIYLLIPLVKKYPELKQEVILCLDILTENASPALVVANRNFRKETKL